MSQPRFVYAVFSFPGTTEEDLPLVAGERIEVLSRDDEFGDGWWEGINSSGQQGLFPKIYTAVTAPAASAGASVTSLNDHSLDAVDEERTSEVSAAAETESTDDEAPRQRSATPAYNEVLSWTPNEVAQHFANLGLDDVSPKFVEHEVDGRILLAMQHTDLREIDINAFGKRFEIIREIDRLRQGEQLSNQAHKGTVTPPLAISPRTNVRGSTIMPQESATGAILQADSPRSSTAESTRNYNQVEPLVPRNNSYSSDLAPPITPGDPLYRPSPNVRKSDETTQNNGHNNSHRKSMSTSSVKYPNVITEGLNGRRSPEKGHSRAWSGDTVKRNSYNRAPTNLDSVDEAAASQVSTDSTPPTPSSTLGSPRSGSNGANLTPTSPSLSSRPTLIAKRSLLGRKPKWRPNAVSENLEQVPAAVSAKEADFCGWLRKRGERSYNWKLRYFVLKGTRLAYYQHDRDTSEKGLIDINSHRVVPVDDILFYGPSKHVFKLVPPAPGASRALNFTPPKTHYFCADTKEQMREWITVFTKATIGRDWSTPVISSCTTKTISLKAAREIRGGRSDSKIDDALETVAETPASPPMLTPEELVAQQQANKAIRPISGHISRNLSISSDSSLRRAVLQVAQNE